MRTFKFFLMVLFLGCAAVYILWVAVFPEHFNLLGGGALLMLSSLVYLLAKNIYWKP